MSAAVGERLPHRQSAGRPKRLVRLLRENACVVSVRPVVVEHPAAVQCLDSLQQRPPCRFAPPTTSRRAGGTSAGITAFSKA